MEEDRAEDSTLLEGEVSFFYERTEKYLPAFLNSDHSSTIAFRFTWSNFEICMYSFTNICAGQPILLVDCMHNRLLSVYSNGFCSILLLRVGLVAITVISGCKRDPKLYKPSLKYS